MPKFYKYIIYRLYTWRVEKDDNTPGTTVESLMCITHYLQMLTVYAILIRFFPEFKLNLDKLRLLLIALAFQVLYHIFVYGKDKWKKYENIFKDETPSQRQRGTIFVYSYMIISTIVFFIMLPILFL